LRRFAPQRLIFKKPKSVSRLRSRRLTLLGLVLYLISGTNFGF